MADFPFWEHYQSYSVLPKLNKISTDDPVFDRDNQYDLYIQQKHLIIDRQPCFLVSKWPHNDKHYCPIMDFIRKKADWVKYYNWYDIGLQVQEDLAVHACENDEDWLAMTHVCFPSGWNPAEKIGKSFAEVHMPVPGMNREQSLRMVKSVIDKGPFERYVWSVVYDKWRKKKLNYYPATKVAHFNKHHPHIHLKVERQTTWGFPEVNAFLFTIRQYLVPEDQIDFKALYHSCKNMTDEQKKYKDISKDCIKYLKRMANQ